MAQPGSRVGVDVGVRRLATVASVRVLVHARSSPTWHSPVHGLALTSGCAGWPRSPGRSAAGLSAQHPRQHLRSGAVCCRKTAGVHAAAAAAAPPGYRLSIPDNTYDLGRFVAEKPRACTRPPWVAVRCALIFGRNVDNWVQRPSFALPVLPPVCWNGSPCAARSFSVVMSTTGCSGLRLLCRCYRRYADIDIALLTIHTIHHTTIGLRSRVSGPRPAPTR